MLRCEMCLGRRIDAELAVLRSVDRSIEYTAGRAIEIDNNNAINVKIDGTTVKVNPSTGALTVEIPDLNVVNGIVETLARFADVISHNYNDLRPMVPDGVNRGKWATETVGAKNKPIYLNSGVIKASDDDIGSSINPIYMDNGQLLHSAANVGLANKPIYMSNGNLTVCNNHLDINAESANKDSDGQTINTTYVKDVTINNDRTVTVTKGDGTSTTSDSLATILNSIPDLIESNCHGKFKYYSIPQGEPISGTDAHSSIFGYTFDLPKTLKTYLIYLVKDNLHNGVAPTDIGGRFLAGRFNETNRKIWQNSNFSIVEQENINANTNLNIFMTNTQFGFAPGYGTGTAVIIFY